VPAADALLGVIFILLSLISFLSGQGKSSVVSLLERFYDPTSGSIELDGVNLKELNVEWLRDQLGLVGQEPVLFDTTIAENIRLGLPEATQEDVENAAKVANAHEFIVSFPDGYDTLVGIGGTQVSRFVLSRDASLCDALTNTR